MNYMLLIYTEEPPYEGELSDEMPSCGGLVPRLQSRGQYVASGILKPTPTATSLRVREGRRLITDGPFAETREGLAGYLLVEADNLDEALKIAAEHPAAAFGTVEVRPVLYSDDWPKPESSRPESPKPDSF
ncbi:YciI family protein [bacterium]|nr:MAG: YciI family protein [bacterium]